MEWRKGFLNEAPPKKPPRRKKAALPDEAFVPAEAYEFADDDDDAVDPRVAEIDSAEEAFEYSREFCLSHINLYNQGLLKLSADCNLNFCNDLKAVTHNRKFFGHHDGPGKGGAAKTMLLPSGIVLHYIEWGLESAPPIVLLHDICDSSHYFDEIARPLADKYRVLAIDMRGHGESSHSSRHLYSIEALVDDLHELVVRLSLNGRDWGGAWTRPWVLCGKGMGAAVAIAYAVRHAGRVAGLCLWEFDPEWPKDRLNFYPYQAAHFANQMAIGAFFNDKFNLNDESKYMSIMFTNQAYHVDFNEDAAGCKFKMDPYFFLSDFNSGIAWTLLREAATKCKIMFLYTENSREWSYPRVMEVVDSLQQGAAVSVRCSIVHRGTIIDAESKQAVEDFSKLFASAEQHILSFADAIDREARAELKSKGGVRYEKYTEAEIYDRWERRQAELQAAKEAAAMMKQDDTPIHFNPDDFD